MVSKDVIIEPEDREGDNDPLSNKTSFRPEASL